MGTPSADGHMPSIDQVLGDARETYASSTDFTLGIEEEFAIVDPTTLDLVPEFERFRDAAMRGGLAEAVAGELIASEVEFRTGRCERWSDAREELSEIRSRVAKVADGLGLAVGASGTHPWADYREQTKIQMPYYQRLVDRLQYVAHRNNTFGMHVHVGVRDADRAIAVADALRAYQPLLLALSCSSPFIDGRDSGLASTRAVTFSRIFPRGNLAPDFGDFAGFERYARWLADTGSIDTIGQMWWGVRLAPALGTVELRCFDGQPDVRDTLALAATAVGLVAHLCELHDAGKLPPVAPLHLVDENVWRAMRWGTDAEFVDLASGRVTPAGSALAELLADAAAAGERAGLGLEEGIARAHDLLERGCSALHQRAMYEESGELRDAYREVVRESMADVASRATE